MLLYTCPGAPLGDAGLSAGLVLCCLWVSLLLTHAAPRGTLTSCWREGGCGFLPPGPALPPSPQQGCSMHRRLGLLPSWCRRTFWVPHEQNQNLLGWGCLELRLERQESAGLTFIVMSFLGRDLSALSCLLQSGSCSQVFVLCSGHLLSLRQGILLILASRAQIILKTKSNCNPFRGNKSPRSLPPRRHV